MTTPAESSTQPNQPTPPVLAQPRPEIVAWMSFLAGQPLADGDIRAIASALFLEGPAAELTAIEARRVLRALTPLDTIGRASAWVALRSNIHAAEQAIGWSRVVNGVLHRHDPVLVPPSSFGDSVVTERSVRDWVLLRNLVTSLARVEQLNDVNGRLLRHALIDPHALPRSIPIRQRVGQAPIARAAIEAMLDGASAELAAGIAEGLVGLDPNDIEVVDQQIERLWLAAELKRLVRVARRH